MSRRQSPFKSVTDRFFMLIFVMGFWTVGLVALKQAMPVITVFVVAFVAVAILRWLYARYR